MERGVQQRPIREEPAVARRAGTVQADLGEHLSATAEGGRQALEGRAVAQPALGQPV